ncbi:ABC transporter permease [Nocardiopsis dassonvillei]|uniref:ABC transporter permease n=1 Tax=Nocardiopsis dassonvillei TaxID=2014 RepID=UPI0033ECBDF9
MVSPALRDTLRKRVRRRAKRNWPELVTLFLITVIGFTLSNSFFVASTSVLGDLERFAQENNQEEGYFLVADGGEGEQVRGEVADGVESVLSADVPGPDDSTLRLFPPRESVNLHVVVAGRDLEADDDVLLDEQYANAHGLEIGDRVTVGSLDLEVVGFATAPDYMTTKSSELVLQPNADDFGMAFVTGDTFDAEFLDEATRQFSFDERTDVASVIDEYAPSLIRDSDNNSRIQQVIGDSAAPRDLAALIFVIFTAIIVALVSVYHFETRRREQRDIATFERLGLASRLRGHYRVETVLTLVAAWIVCTALTAVAATPIMSINGRLYNYPPLSVDVPVLVAVSLVTLAVLLLVDYACYRMVHRRPRQRRRARREPRVSTSGLRFIPDFGLRLRLVKALRNPREPLSLVALVLIVSLFVNFSFMLKISVDEYVAMLETDTDYEYMYVLSDAVAEAGLERDEDELARLTTLYDDEHVAQMVFSVPSDSRFFGEVDEPTVTEAFADKYGVGEGSELRFTDIEGEAEYTLEVGAVTDNATSALVYVPEDQRIEDSGTRAPSVPVAFTGSRHPDLHDAVPSVSRESIASSGESIVEIINIQVSLLIGIAVALLAIMLLSIYRFTFATQGEFVRIMRMNGYSPGVLNRAVFGYTVPLVVSLVALTAFAASAVVRAFFDRIMSTFVTFVPASTSYLPFALTCSTVLVLFAVVLIRSRSRLRRS